MRNAVSTWCRVRLAGVVFLALVLTGLAAPVKSGKDETVPAVGARFRLLRDAVARPLPAVQGARARRNDTGEEIDLCKARDAWFHDQCVGYWSAPGAKIYAGRPALVAPTELPVLQEGYVIRGDYDAWRAHAGLPEPPDADAVREWAHAFADADPDGEPRPLKELPATTVQQFRFQPAADGTVRDGYWVVNRRDPAQRLFLLYVLEPGAEVERSRKICLQLAQTVTFSPVADTTVARQRKAAWGVKKPEGSPEYAAERAKVIQNIRSLKDWWYVETENYILVANLKDGQVDRKRLARFAKLIGTRILEFVPRDQAVREAEFARHKTAVERAPKSAFAKSLKSLAAKILTVRKEDCPVPTPMDDRSFYGAW